MAGPLPDCGEPDGHPTEVVDEPLATGDAADLLWLVIALGVIATAMWWRRRRRRGLSRHP